MQASFVHDGDTLRIISPSPIAKGKEIRLRIHYSSQGSADGFHWIKRSAYDSTRIGFWTMGQPMHNHDWIPLWDYPNDLATSETRVTVPANWYVVGNGMLRGNTLSSSGTQRTFQWEMIEPHATYLLSLAAGPFDIKAASWRGLPLLYVVPAGKAKLIDQTFGRTPELLSFFSGLLGVGYPWPKYAQSALYDFNGGMENVSATSFGTGTLADLRNGPDPSADVIAHELAHQWFGDLVTYRDWGEVWLGEGFATYFGQLLYDEHWRGKAQYDHRVESMTQGYLDEARRYERPLVTNRYENADAMFDNHTYLKGALVLHMLRRTLGDSAFFRGLRHYLTKYRHTAVDSHDLEAALTESSGVNVAPFFEQWVYKRGHPVLDYRWQWDQSHREVLLTVKQLQDTTAGTPIYDLPLTVGLISNGALTRKKIRSNQRSHEFLIPALRRPDALLLDPDHDLLREVPSLHWAPEELPQIFEFAPDAVDQEAALDMMTNAALTPATSSLIFRVLSADTAPFPRFQSIAKVGELGRSEFRPLFHQQLGHSNVDRRAQAVLALGYLPKDDSDAVRIRRLVNDSEAYTVVRAAVRVLGNWDPEHNRDVFQRASLMESPFDGIRVVALDAILKADSAEGRARVDPDTMTTRSIRAFLGAVAVGDSTFTMLTARQRAMLAAKGNPRIARLLQDSLRFVPLACDDVRQKHLVQNNEDIERICYYKMFLRGAVPVLFKFSLTANSKVAWYANYPADY